MKKNIISVLLITLTIGVLLTACGSKTVDGKYVNSTKGYIQLKKDGSFIIDNGVQLTGKYSIKGKDIIFDVEKMYGEEVGNTVKGKIEGDTITDPSNITYEKES